MATEEELSTRERIIKAGAQIIVEEGLRKFTAKNIGYRVGITDAAIYKHFPSLDNIVIEIINRYISRCSGSVDRALAMNLPVEETLRQVIKEHISVLEETNGAVPILCFEFSRSGNVKFFDILQSFVENYREKLARILKKGQEEGIVRADIDPKEIAMLFIGLIQAKVFAYIIEKREGPIIKYPDQLISELFYGIMKR